MGLYTIQHAVQMRSSSEPKKTLRTKCSHSLLSFQRYHKLTVQIPTLAPLDPHTLVPPRPHEAPDLLNHASVVRVVVRKFAENSDFGRDTIGMAWKQLQ